MNKRKVKEVIIKTKEKTLNLKGELEKVMRVRDARDRKIFYTALIIIFLIIIYLVFVRGYFVKKEKAKEAQEKATIEKIRQERVKKVEEAPKSISSFFLSHPFRASLSMPDYWEGNYRLSEKDGKASFLYIEDSSQIVEIFYIRFLPEDQLGELAPGEQETDPNKRVKKGDITYAFVYKIYEDNPYPENKDLKFKFDRMRIDAQEMVNKYFKTF